MRCAFFELGPEKGGGDLARKKRRTDILPGIFVDFAPEKPAAIGSLFAHDFGAKHQLRIVHEQAAAFARMNVLGFVKTEAAEIADRARARGPCSSP